MAATFTKRYTRPTAANLEYVRREKGGWSQCVKGSPTDSACDSLANCVGYACGRFNEIINEMRGTKGLTYPYLNNNAEDWVERIKKMYPDLKFSDHAQAGAIMCWAKGQAGKDSDGAGHVAIVEEVIDDNTIKTSESAYGGTAFYVSTRKNDNGRWGLGSAYTFRTFILNPAVVLVEPVARDTSVDQIEVITTVLRMRSTPDDSIKTNIWGSFAPVGLYNVLETKKVKASWGDTWYRIGDDIWIAGVEETKFYEGDSSELVKLRLENAELKARLEEIRKAGKWLNG